MPFESTRSKLERVGEQHQPHPSLEDTVVLMLFWKGLRCSFDSFWPLPENSREDGRQTVRADEAETMLEGERQLQLPLLSHYQ